MNQYRWSSSTKPRSKFLSMRIKSTSRRYSNCSRNVSDRKSHHQLTITTASRSSIFNWTLKKQSTSLKRWQIKERKIRGSAKRHTEFVTSSKTTTNNWWSKYSWCKTPRTRWDKISLISIVSSMVRLMITIKWRSCSKASNRSTNELTMGSSRIKKNKRGN